MERITINEIILTLTCENPKPLDSPKAKDSVPTTSAKANSKDLLTTTSSKAKSKDSVPTTSSKAKSKDILLSKSTNHAKPKAGPTDSLRRSTRTRN